MKTTLKLLGFFLFIHLMACKPSLNGPDDVVLARVKDKYFTYSDIKSYIAPGTNPADSLQMVQGFVNAWVRNEILVQHAENNLPDSLKDFSKQMNEYRNSLLLFHFKKLYVSQELDTVISENEIEEYYQQHLTDFELKENIVQFSFIQMDENSKKLDKARSLFRNLGDSKILKLEVEKFCLENGIDFYTDDEKWIRFADLLVKIPINTYNETVFLRNNRFIELKDSPNVYFVYIKDYKIKEEISPIEFQHQNIEKIIINKRKLLLVEQMENALFEKALKQKNFEIY